MYDPLARHVLDRLLARQDARLWRLIEEIAPVALAARSVEALADMVLDAVALAPLALDAATLIDPERTDGGAWLWAAPLTGGRDLVACVPSRWMALTQPATDSADTRSYLVFLYDDDAGMTAEDMWRLFQRDWRDARAWVAVVNDLNVQARRRWRMLDIARIATRTRASAPADDDAHPRQDR
jgi:hypothetical protein